MNVSWTGTVKKNRVTKPPRSAKVAAMFAVPPHPMTPRPTGHGVSIVVWLWLLLLPGLGAAVASGQPVRIGVERIGAPMAFIDEAGRPAGFSAELIAAMQATGLEVELVQNHWSELLREFEAGRLDVLSNVVARPGRLPLMDYSIGHASVHGVVYRRPGDPPITSTAQFAGKRIGVVPGTVAYFHAMAHDGWGGTLQVYPGWQAMLDATHRDECDLALVLSTLSSRLVNPHQLRTNFVDDIIFQYRMAVRQGDQATLARINDALAEVKHSGTFDRLYAKWIGPIEPHPIAWVDLKPYRYHALATVLLLAALFGWQRHMLRRLSRQAAALKESEERWKFALEGSGDGVWDWDVKSDRVICSRRWKEMLGYADEDIGTNPHEWRDRIHPEDLDAVMAAQRNHLEGRTPNFSAEHRLQCKDGSWKWVLIRGMAVARDDSGAPLRVIGTLTDLTGRKQAEEDRLVLSKLESTGVLAGGIAHDFNNLLTAILLNLDLARIQIEDRATLLQRVDGAQTAALSARGLTQQLITFARGGGGAAKVADIGRILRESLPLALTGSNVRGDLSVAPDLRPARVDADQIGQVIRNLVINAREAMPRGGVITLRAANVNLPSSAHAVRLPPGIYLHLSVEDQGEGIAPENLRKIFDPYFSTKQRGQQKGMGLGLTICHSILQRHAGTITVESVLNRGTTFHVYLPASIGSAPDIMPAATDPVPPGPGRRILVMDDDETIRETIGQILRHLGHAVTLTADGQAAVAAHAAALRSAEPFDLVLLDLTVPGGMGGREALQAMRQVEAGIRAVVISGYTDDAVLQESARHGFAAALAKPFETETLRRLIADLAD